MSYYKRHFPRDGFKPEYETKHLLKKRYSRELVEVEDITLEEVLRIRGWFKISKAEFKEYKESKEKRTTTCLK